jgi:hypothetical protein
MTNECGGSQGSLRSSQTAVREYFECACDDAEHVIRVTRESALFPLGGYPWPTVYVQVQMGRFLPLHRRIWVAIRFVFGAQDCHWADTILTDGNVERLRDLLDAEIALSLADYEADPNPNTETGQ